jgi:rhodanese-related sulfurtransferase
MPLHQPLASLLLLAAALAGGGSSVSAQEVAADGARRITQQDLKVLIAARNVIIVDTRDAVAYRDGHIPSAILLPLEGAHEWSSKYEKTIGKLKSAGKPVVTYCACPGEATAARAAVLLGERGVKDARALVGGWSDWFNDENRIEKGK